MTDKEIRGSIACRMSGGPLDGATYGDLPRPGEFTENARLSIPLAQPAESAPHAVYVCTRLGGPDDVWEFQYVKTIYPGLPVGTKVVFK